MVRGSTPTLTFSDVPYVSSNIDSANVIIKQGDDIYIIKKKSELTFATGSTSDTTNVSVTLTESETFDFASDEDIEIQLFIKLASTDAIYHSPVFTRTVEYSIRKGVLKS